MKTPKEILLAENRHHDSLLEDIQRNVIAQALPPSAKRLGLRQSSAAFHKVSLAFWRRLILPARRIWLGYAFTWLAIAIFRIATADPTPTQIAKSTTTSSEAIANWKEQQIILTELTKPISHDPVDRPKQHPMGPRSEARTIAIG